MSKLIDKLVNKAIGMLSRYKDRQEVKEYISGIRSSQKKLKQSRSLTQAQEKALLDKGLSPVRARELATMRVFAPSAAACGSGLRLTSSYRFSRRSWLAPQFGQTSSCLVRHVRRTV